MEDATQALELTPSNSMAGDTPVPTKDLTGRTIGDFRILRRLGEGGMGQVYLAEQVSLQRKVALKVLKKELSADYASLERFKAEALAVARVTHANIVQVYAIDEEADLHYMALEYVEGRNLRDYLAKKGTLDAPLAISIMRQVAAALQRAAELGIIHRDIKPENILLTRKGEVKVADFGLSRSFGSDGKMLNLTQSGVTMGTPLYMSPEQVQGFTLDPRTDIYSFGVTCYHMLSGQPPFRSGTAFEVALQHVQAEPEPLTKIRPDLPTALCAIVHKMMAKKPDDRYQTSRDLLRDLSKLRDSTSGASSALVASSLAEFSDASATSPNLPKSRTSIEVGPPASLLLPQGAKRRWWHWALPASIVVALLAGSSFAYLNRKSVAKNDSPSTNNIDLGQVEVQLSPNKREQTLRDTAKLYADPGKDQHKIEFGLEVYRELALLYLDQGRWEEADQLFQELIKNTNQVDIYAQFGKLGHAIILGLQSKPVDSNRLFGECLPKLPEKVLIKRRVEPGDRFNHALVVLGNPKIRQWIAEALEYNYKNDPTSFPRSLEPWRKGLLAASPPGGKSDKSDK